MIRTALALVTLTAAMAAPLAHAENIIGLRESDGHLISFDSATPGTLSGDLALTGFPASVIGVAVDFRPSTLGLVIVGNGPTNTQCQLYTVNTLSGAVTAVGAVFTCAPLGAEPFNDIDFNPVADAIRVIGGVASYVVNATSGVRTNSTNAAYVAGDVNFGVTPDIRETAYDQNTSGATTTTLFAIDEGVKALVRVGSVNGTPDAPGTGKLTTIGSLGVGVNGGAFDISGTAPNTAYLFEFAPPFAAGANGKLYTVNLGTGAATLVGKIGTASLNLLGMTVAPGVTLPAAPATLTAGSGAFGLGTLGLLLGALLLGRRRSA